MELEWITSNISVACCPSSLLDKIELWLTSNIFPRMISQLQYENDSTRPPWVKTNTFHTATWPLNTPQHLIKRTPLPHPNGIANAQYHQISIRPHIETSINRKKKQSQYTSKPVSTAECRIPQKFSKYIRGSNTSH